MSIYQLKTQQKIPASLDEVWDFISSPQNLKKITPSYMGFEITNGPIPDKMYPGMIIAYKVSPVLGIPMEWVTEITHVKDRTYFVDEQRVGPYSIWHHQHHLTEIDGGVLMDDIVSYLPPFGPFGKIANSLFIASQLKVIFDYRFEAVEKIFGKFP
ncbi:MAG: SRPBCC family protein [Saprospiraceae bacterium]|nr:SRPBCC family protein [Saprospiraceae bacterium]